MAIKSMENAFSLKGKNAIVTGGNRGIGLGISEAFAQQGANVAILCRNENSGKELAERFSKTYDGKFFCVRTDVASRESCKAAVNAVIEAFGHIDILVNNAGAKVVGPLLEMDESLAQWDECLQIDLSGAFYMSYFTGRHMREHKLGGRIINISSNAGEIVNLPMLMGAYSVSKAGLNRLTKYLAYELAKDGVRVNAIAPGYINSNNPEIEVEEVFGNPASQKIPVGRVGSIMEMGALAVYLASDASDFMTGMVLTADGGYSLAM